MAMLPFCGYNMADYFKHWLQVGTKTEASKLPQIFFVNWFRRDEEGRFMWPGYGENSRVLKWVFERLNGTAQADKTAIGYLPSADSLDTNGMNINTADLQAITSVDVDGWREAVPQIRDHYAAFGDRLPNELAIALDALESSLS
jgi:phosphoenolpyruvate carboxykinase (GTP)